PPVLPVVMVDPPIPPPPVWNRPPSLPWPPIPLPPFPPDCVEAPPDPPALVFTAPSHPMKASSQPAERNALLFTEGRSFMGTDLAAGGEHEYPIRQPRRGLARNASLLDADLGRSFRPTWAGSQRRIGNTQDGETYEHEIGSFPRGTCTRRVPG